MADNEDIKHQRDRFLAFAFASADLFIEISEKGDVLYATGAAMSLTGVDFGALVGLSWTDLFSRNDRAALISMRKRAKDGVRCGPLQVKLIKEGLEKEAIITGFKLPDSQRFYLTASFPSDLQIKLAGIVRQQEELKLLDKDTFMHAANEAFDLARSMGEGIDITLLDIPKSEQIKEELGSELWDQFTESITELLSSNSIDGQAAAQIQDGRYSVIHDKNIDSDTLRNQLSELGKETDPEGKGFEVTSKTVSSNLESLSERETTKALIYTINEFERKGTNLNIETLNSGFKAYVSANAQKIHHFKTIIEQLNFNLSFQPIVGLEDNTLSHFEILSRFKEEGSTQEWIIFGEDIGMAADFDMAVCERVINYLLYKGSENRMKFAMNLSGQSMQNEQFFKTLMAKLDMHSELAKRMVFEITESTIIKNLQAVNHHITMLQNKGYQCCLDDFGAGSASFQYIQQLHVDYVKIDGQYTRKILSSDRDQLMVKNLAQLCKDLKIGTISEQIETKEQVDKVKALGINYGQGYYFGYPAANPGFDPDNLPAKSPE